ncbi:MAG: SDR family oxidoreductase [Bacteroidota bacterium]|nr:SDR family oxidoreductase [Bacteroidota bacterium]MDP4250733.1 SDR family oxidoreductase [Bacteroidota bacterium]
MPFALITGASKGIGKAIALSLAARGYDLLLIARSEDLLKEASIEISTGSGRLCHYLALDLSTDHAAELVHAWCTKNQFPVSVLVNNAGYGLSGSFEKYSAETHAEMLHLNIITLVMLTRRFLPDLKKQPASYILNIGSSAAYQAVPFLSAYAASKSFVLSFSRGLSQELRGTTVSVTCVCPGPTDTNFVNRANIGKKGQKAAARFNMSPETVAHIAVSSLFKRKTEVITGGMNKLSAFFAWLLPKSVVEGVAKKLYD